MRAAKFAKEILSKLWVTLLSLPIIGAATAYYSHSLSAMLSSFDPDWYRDYWYLVLLAVVLGVLQFIVLWAGERTVRNGVISLLVLIALLAVYSWKQIAKHDFPFDWPLLAFFFLYCVLVSQVVWLSAFGMIRITCNILAATETSKTE